MRGSLTISNIDVSTPFGIKPKTGIVIENGKISYLTDKTLYSAEIDGSSLLAVPGLIDIHTHGILDIMTEDCSLIDYARVEARSGATTFIPSFFSHPGKIADNLKRHIRETDGLSKTPQIPGFRLESPYLAKTGGGSGGDTAPISTGTTKMLLQAGGEFIKIWDISPELPGAIDLISELTGKGIICSIAHTGASIEQARSAFDAGATMVTHLYDTFDLPLMKDIGVYPQGLVDYILTEDRVYCEIIGDGTHVYPLLIEKTLRCKTPGKVIFITDSNYGAGFPPGKYILPGNFGEALIDGPNNGVRLTARDMILAGSALTPIDSFRNAVQLFGMDIITASEVCSKTPATLLGLNKGEISTGYDADILILNKNMEIVYTISGGEIIFKA